MSQHEATPCPLVLERSEKVHSSVGRPRLPSPGSLVIVLVRVVPPPGELHRLTAGPLSLDSKPQNYDILEASWSTAAHGGPRRKASGTPGPGGNTRCSLGSSCLLVARCLEERDVGKNCTYVAGVWVCIPKQDGASRLGAVSTGLRTGSTEVNGLGIQNWG